MNTVTKFILINSLVAILMLSGFAFYSLDRYDAAAVKEQGKELENCIKTFREFLRYKGEEFRIRDQKLLAGNYPLNDDFEVPDKVQEIFGGVATVFMGDVRVSTNVLDGQGKRALGTRLVGPAYEAVFGNGKAYRGEADILGTTYLTAYDPIRDGNGKTIGALFVGLKKSDFQAGLKGLKVHMAMTMCGMLALFTILMVLMARNTRKNERRNEDQLRFLQTLLDTIPSPVYYKGVDGCYLGCNKAFETVAGLSRDDLVGKSVHEIWPGEQASRLKLQDQELLGNPGIQVYEESIDYADGSRHEVVFNKATFHYEDGSLRGLVAVMLDITDRKRAEEALAFQNIQLSTQQEASIDGILVVDENSRILSCNRRFVEIMGIPSGLFEAGDDARVLQFVTLRMADPPKFYEKVKSLYENRLESCRDEVAMGDGKILDRYTVPLLGSDGRYYGRFWSFRDITERKAAEESTKNAYQQLHDIVEFLPDPTFVVDKQKRVIAWNRAIEMMTGVDKKDVLGQGEYVYSIPFYGARRPILIDLIDEDINTLRRNYDYINVEGRTLFAETFVPAFRDGKGCYLWGTASPLFDSQGNQVGGIESIRDITEYKLAEEEKTRLQSQLHQASMMQNLMVRLGHDLKTPLTPLFILLPLIRRQISDPDLISKVDSCIKCAASINNLADKTRILAGLSSAAKSSERCGVSLASVVDYCLGDCRDMLLQKQLECRNTIDHAVVVQAVPDQLRELLLNLIMNAVQFSTDGGVIVISCEQNGETMTISVQDGGIGIDAAHIDHIFDEFYKVDDSRHDINTYGLGLSICKRIVESHHGRIWAESAGLGQGTTIRFTINEK